MTNAQIWCAVAAAWIIAVLLMLALFHGSARRD